MVFEDAASSANKVLKVKYFGFYFFYSCASPTGLGTVRLGTC
jgi:hypothetical protein